ncbi:MAG: hypothetical protein DMG79_05845 [Acidobacteria bacterium]|nr:MAG: hypothetical protein DMG79_05845 [Acidobacteriota bacterium]
MQSKLNLVEPRIAVKADAYVFDIDGTILVTRDLVHWNGLHKAMLEVYGVDTTIEGIPYHGKTDIGILRAALERCGIGGSAFERGLPEARAVICREVSAHATEILGDVCPAIPELLLELSASGKLLGIASGNLEIVGWHKVNAARVREFFSFGCFGDHSESRSEIFANAISEIKRRLGSDARACFIGDTPEDIRAARHVQAQIVAVSTGTYSRQELASLTPDGCCRSCTEMLGSLR